MLNQARLRIVQELAQRESTTSTELCAAMTDIPRTTIYRHIAVLIENGLVTIVSERRIRGSVERTLALNVGKFRSDNSLKNASQTAFAFLMGKYALLHDYFNGKDADPGRDRVFLNNSAPMMSDAEFDRFLSELQALLVKYSHGPGDGRKARDISILSSPAEPGQKTRDGD